ncbi:hypothetical protein C6T65_09780 [Burkholderia vietnamiensis]|uniref:Uncharacterized protein n=1 Tax=Burkholderia vietnamiensis TaxID=60552 RepID=A0AA44Y1I7_BURVI|nr:hypothetical protein A8H33_11545 [Burkholderia vietnamiensis]PRH42531.1 hypothetical protein C6T65_09780 [Burkholderia vietnamiensis]RQM56080.1 hypothetical protein EHZ18_17525 [Burkholderia vietnamiensis]
MFEIRHGVSIRGRVAAQRAGVARAAEFDLAGSCPRACRPAIAKLRSTLNVSCQPRTRGARSVLQSPDTRRTRAARGAPRRQRRGAPAAPAPTPT